mgnify:CR=1 FL=1
MHQSGFEAEPQELHFVHIIILDTTINDVPDENINFFSIHKIQDILIIHATFPFNLILSKEIAQLSFYLQLC